MSLKQGWSKLMSTDHVNQIEWTDQIQYEQLLCSHPQHNFRSISNICYLLALYLDQYKAVWQSLHSLSSRERVRFGEQASLGIVQCQVRIYNVISVRLIIHIMVGTSYTQYMLQIISFEENSLRNSHLDAPPTLPFLPL
jgi:hypothetical protein